MNAAASIAKAYDKKIFSVGFSLFFLALFQSCDGFKNVLKRFFKPLKEGVFSI